MTQTTQERIRSTIDAGLTIVTIDVNDGYTPSRSQARVVSEVVNEIAAEIDALRAEVERLTPAAEAWGTWEAWNRACNADPLPPPEVTRHLHREFWEAAARAREAKP